MRARIITICDQIGDCGKTTLTMQLAGALTRRGYLCLVVDADPRGFAMWWAASAPEDHPFPAPVISLSTKDSKLHYEVGKSIKRYDFILIDCPPVASSLIVRYALLVADLALVPLVLPLRKIWKTGNIRQVIDNTKVINQTLEVRLVTTHYDPNKTTERENAAFFRLLGIEPLHVKIAHRIAYSRSKALGTTVYDGRVKAPVAALAEINALATEVLSILASKKWDSQ